MGTDMSRGRNHFQKGSGAYSCDIVQWLERDRDAIILYIYICIQLLQPFSLVELH